MISPPEVGEVCAVAGIGGLSMRREEEDISATFELRVNSGPVEVLGQTAFALDGLEMPCGSRTGRSFLDVSALTGCR